MGAHALNWKSAGNENFQCLGIWSKLTKRGTILSDETTATPCGCGVCACVCSSGALVNITNIKRLTTRATFIPHSFRQSSVRRGCPHTKSGLLRQRRMGEVSAWWYKLGRGRRVFGTNELSLVVVTDVARPRYLLDLRSIDNRKSGVDFTIQLSN